MKLPGLFVAFESAPKCGKSTLAALLKKQLETARGSTVLLNRGALSVSEFSKKIDDKINEDTAYSTAFYWADAVFNTSDSIVPMLQRRDGVVIQDRYDLSIVVYREIHGLNGDAMLLDEYLKRGMIVHPDITVFPRPDPEVVFERIRNDPMSSAVDRKFEEYRDRLIRAQDLYQRHLTRLGRRVITLDTHLMTPEECVGEIVCQIDR
jgi:thymidylate kinase